MKSELAKKLKNLLDNMSQEEFDLAWQEVAERNVDSPSFAEYLQFLNGVSFYLPNEMLRDEYTTYKYQEENDSKRE